MSAPAADHSPRSEMFWRPDAAVEAARKLPEWGAFHAECGRSGLCFDHIERDGKRGAYLVDAMQIVRRGVGYTLKLLATGRNPEVIAALRAAYEQSGIVVPEAAAMLARGLAGVRGGVTAEVVDALTAVRLLIADPFEELFG